MILYFYHKYTADSTQMYFFLWRNTEPYNNIPLYIPLYSTNTMLALQNDRILRTILFALTSSRFSRHKLNIIIIMTNDHDRCGQVECASLEGSLVYHHHSSHNQHHQLWSPIIIITIVSCDHQGECAVVGLRAIPPSCHFLPNLRPTKLRLRTNHHQLNQCKSYQ